MRAQHWIIGGLDSRLGMELARRVLDRGATVLGLTDSFAPEIVDLSVASSGALTLAYPHQAGRNGSLEGSRRAGDDQIDVVVASACHIVTSDDHLHRTCDLLCNVASSVAALRSLLPQLRRQGGGIVIRLSTFGQRSPFAEVIEVDEVGPAVTSLTLLHDVLGGHDGHTTTEAILAEQILELAEMRAGTTPLAASQPEDPDTADAFSVFRRLIGPETSL